MNYKKLLIIAILIILLIAVIGVLLVRHERKVSLPATTQPGSETENRPDTEERMPVEAASSGTDDPEEGMPDLDDALPEGLSEVELRARIDAMTITTATGTRALTESEKQAVKEDYQ